MERIGGNTIKNIAAIIAAITIFSVPSWAAFSKNIVWEIDVTNGLSTNGGGFCSTATAASGVDYSQGVFHSSGTDLVVENSVSSNAVTSASIAFDTDDIGNVIYVRSPGVAGWTTGWYEITDVTSNQAILDRTPGNVGTTAGTWTEGGALSNIGLALWAPTPGATCWIKQGTYTITSAISYAANDGLSTYYISWYGYYTTRGDSPTGDDMPFFSQAANNIAFGDYSRIQNIHFSCTADPGVSGASQCFMQNIKIENTSTTALRRCLDGGSNSVLEFSFITSVNGYGVNAFRLYGNRLYRNTFYGCNAGINADRSTGHGCVVMENLIVNCSTGILAIQSGNQKHVFTNNTIDNCVNGIVTASDTPFIKNNLISNCTNALVVVGANIAEHGNNNYWNCISTYVNCSAGNGDTYTNPSYTNAATLDYSVGTGFKETHNTTFPGTATTTFGERGAAQRQEPAATGGGGGKPIPSMAGEW